MPKIGEILKIINNQSDKFNDHLIKYFSMNSDINGLEKLKYFEDSEEFLEENGKKFKQANFKLNERQYRQIDMYSDIFGSATLVNSSGIYLNREEIGKKLSEYYIFNNTSRELLEFFDKCEKQTVNGKKNCVKLEDFYSALTGNNKNFAELPNFNGAENLLLSGLIAGSSIKAVDTDKKLGTKFVGEFIADIDSSAAEYNNDKKIYEYRHEEYVALAATFVLQRNENITKEAEKSKSEEVKDPSTETKKEEVPVEKEVKTSPIKKEEKPKAKEVEMDFSDISPSESNKSSANLDISSSKFDKKVLEAQRKLIDLGYDLGGFQDRDENGVILETKGGCDGVKGQYTENAVKRFQEVLGLNANGVIDDKTVAALKEVQQIKDLAKGQGKDLSMEEIAAIRNEVKESGKDLAYQDISSGGTSISTGLAKTPNKSIITIS